MRSPSIALLALMAIAQAAAAQEENVLKSLRPEHPRLMLTDQRLEELKQQMACDKLLARFADDVIAEAKTLLNAPPLEPTLQGGHMLGVSRRCLQRVYALGLAWRLTGEEAFAEALKQNLLTVSAFSHWNPKHFLDTAEMSHAVGVGYDWLYNWLDEPTRKIIRQALIKHGLEMSLVVYANNGWWVRSDCNWNQVCNGGMIVGALAIADSDPQYARQIIPLATRSLPIALATYDPDGAWPEGPSYWAYATSYTVYALAALQTALGDDMGLSQRRGLEATARFPMLAAGPTGLLPNYADTDDVSRLKPSPVFYWLGKRYGLADVAVVQTRMLANAKASPLDFVWYWHPSGSSAWQQPLDKLFRGQVPLAVFRSAWDDTQALFACIKAGFNTVNHGHLDLGSFELHALGQRWARDLGKDSYVLPGYFEKRIGGGRWQYFRTLSRSHNVLMVDDADQAVLATAAVTGFGQGEQPCAIIDLTSAYPDAAASLRRGLMLVDGRKGVLVQDELTLKGEHDLAWGMTTDAKIRIDGAAATLSLGGKRLTARVLSPAGAVFSAESAEQAPPQAANKGVSRLMVRLKGVSGDVRIAVLLWPNWPGAETPAEIGATALDAWPAQMPVDNP